MTDHTAPELKPCPFCGGDNTAIEGKGQIWNGVKGYSDPQYFELRHYGNLQPNDTFPRCSVVFRHRTEVEAIAAWNTRAPDPDIDAHIGAVLEQAAETCERVAYADFVPHDDLIELGCLRSRDAILALRPDALQALERVRREARVEGMRAALAEIRHSPDQERACDALRDLIEAERGKP